MHGRDGEGHDAWRWLMPLSPLMVVPIVLAMTGDQDSAHDVNHISPQCAGAKHLLTFKSLAFTITPIGTPNQAVLLRRGHLRVVACPPGTYSLTQPSAGGGRPYWWICQGVPFQAIPQSDPTIGVSSIRKRCDHLGNDTLFGDRYLEHARSLSLLHCTCT